MSSYVAFCLKTPYAFFAAHPSYQKSKIKGLFSNSPGQRLPICQENGIPVYRAAREYGAPQSMLKDRVHIVSQLTLIKSLDFVLFNLVEI